jgi:hypothetical protein
MNDESLLAGRAAACGKSNFVYDRRLMPESLNGRRLYAYGRGDGSQLLVVVLSKTRAGWRPRTAWEMDDVERRWWRKHGGR